MRTSGLEQREVDAQRVGAHQVVVIGEDGDDSPAPVSLELIDISELHEDETNARRGNVDAIEQSLDEFSQHRFVVAQRDGRVVVGNHMLRAAKRKGWKKVLGMWVDDDDAKGTRRGLADNRTGDLAQFEDEQLRELFNDIDIEGEPLAGFDDDFLNELFDVAPAVAQQQATAAHVAYSEEEVIGAAFKYFRDAGFPYRNLELHECMQEINRLAAMSLEDDMMHSTLGYQVADTYHPHRFAAKATSMRSPLESFEEDKALRKALKLALDDGLRIGKTLVPTMLLVNGTQACANFRPAYAMHFYRKYAGDGAVVLDTCAGYGGRLVGAIAAGNVRRYIGIDPNAETCTANMRLAKELWGEVHAQILNLPAEDVQPSSLDACDFAFTSPPYFGKERYNNQKTQSWRRYPEPQQWREGFLRKMLALQHAALKGGAINAIVVADVTVGKHEVPLVDWTTEDGKAQGFELVEARLFDLSVRFGANMGEGKAAETLLVFKKT